METTTRYIVVAHKDRYAIATDLADYLSADISVDLGDLGSNANHDRAWKMASKSGQTWSAVIEDDVILTDNFLDHVQDALAHMPSEGVLSLYSGYPRPLGDRVKRAVHNARASGHSFLRYNSLLWGPAVLMPSRLVPSMLKMVSRINSLQYDQRFSFWTSRHRIPVYYTMPSLVEHRDEPSLIWGDRPPRKAWWFGEPHDWNSNFTDI